MEEAVRYDDYAGLRSLVDHLDENALEALLFMACDYGAENCAAILLNMGVDKGGCNVHSVKICRGVFFFVVASL